MPKAIAPGEAPCPYDMDVAPDGVRMRVRCRGCPGKSDLADDECFRGVLRSFVGESHADALMLSSYSDREYAEEALRVLRGLSELWEQSVQLGARVPGQGKMCEKCGYHPGEVFPALSEAVLSGFGPLYSVFRERARTPATARAAPGCDECLGATERDVLYLFGRLEELRRFIMLSGFSVHV